MYKLTQEGKDYLEKGLPERRLLELLLSGEKTMQELRTFPNVSIAIGWARKNNWIKIIEGKVSITDDGKRFIDNKTLLEEALQKIKVSGNADEENVKSLLSRNLIEEEKEARIEEPVKRKVGFLEKIGLVKRKFPVEIQKPDPGEVKITTEIKQVKDIAQLTPELIKSGQWKKYPFKKYDVTTPAPKLIVGKKQPYIQFIEDIQDKLVGLGFKEMTGPLVETFFWNCDALFMPQDHPGRSVHDVFMVKTPSKGKLPDKNLVARVKATHEGGWVTDSTGWGGVWSEEESSKLLMRSQGTPMSARTLVEHGDKPGKFFSISRQYRYDVIDAKHLIEFDQCEGIVIGEGLNFRNLLAMLKEFGKMVGVKDVKFKPGYFPFTEPSVELFMKFPKFGWVEIGGAGLFRPEVLRPLGIEKSQVLAWGLGLGRLAMIKLGIDDIRHLYSDDLGFLRNAPVVK